LQDLLDISIDGFAPVITNITPLPTVLPVPGLGPRKKEDADELSRLNYGSPSIPSPAPGRPG